MAKSKGSHPPDGFNAAVKAFRGQGRVLRTMEIIKAGVHPRTLYAMHKAGIIDRLGRGVYRLSDGPPLGNPDLVLVAKKVPRGVICLISALAFHGLTTQVPHAVYLALPRHAEYPRIQHPPVRIFQMAEATLREGVETHVMDGVPVRIHNPERTIADCFKYRNRIGMDTVLEALRMYRKRRKPKVGDLLRFAAVCRMGNVMRPYLEALL
jgi:predicted transcriptional regulator of viral defense system